MHAPEREHSPEVNMNQNIEAVPTAGSATAPTASLPDEALVNAHYIRPLIGNPSDPTLWRWINKGDFPEPERRTGPAQSGSRLWRLGDIRKWLRGEWTRERVA